MKGKMKMKKGGAAPKHSVTHKHSKEAHVEHHHYKKGGDVHKAKGGKHMPRADKRARGGRMSPKSPLSGANPTKQRPGAKLDGKPDSSND